MHPTRIALTLAMLILALTACGRSPETEAARAETRLDELEQEFNELGDDATWEEVGKILDEAEELANRPATPETIRAAHKDLDELRAVWEQLLVHVAEAEEVIEREGYANWWTLAQTQDERDRALARHTETIANGSEATVRNRRQSISTQIDSLSRRIEKAQEIIGRPARDAARREQALRDLAELERHNEQVLALHRAIRDAHTDPWEKRWADDIVRQTEELGGQDLAEARKNLESGEEGLANYAVNWIERALEGAPQELARLRRQLDEIRAGAN